MNKKKIFVINRNGDINKTVRFLLTLHHPIFNVPKGEISDSSFRNQQSKRIDGRTKKTRSIASATWATANRKFAETVVRSLRPRADVSAPLLDQRRTIRTPSRRRHSEASAAGVAAVLTPIRIGQTKIVNENSQLKSTKCSCCEKSFAKFIFFFFF